MIKLIYVSVIFLLISCSQNHPTPHKGLLDVEEKAPNGFETPRGVRNYKGKYPIPMIEDLKVTEKKLEGFKISVLNGYCNVDPRELADRGNEMSFQEGKVEFRVKREACIEVVEREARWIDDEPATLYVIGGVVKSKCPDNNPDTNAHQVFHFEMDLTEKYLAVYSTTAKGCWWAKRID